MVTPIGLSDIGGNFFWIWGIICFSFVPLTYFFGVESKLTCFSNPSEIVGVSSYTDFFAASGRTLEQVDRMFMDEPRICMGLNPNHTRVIKYSREDEENRFKAFANLDEKRASIAEIDRRLSLGSTGGKQ